MNRLTGPGATQGPSGIPDRAISGGTAECIASLYSRSGMDAVRQLQGSFALCLVDLQVGSVHLLRDRLGGRSLFVHLRNGLLVASSHPEHLASHSQISAEEHPDYLALRIAYAGFPPTGLSPFKSIDELLPGEYWRIQNWQAKKQRRPLAVPARLEPLPVNEAVEGLRRRMQQSITEQLHGLERCAAMLSGGLDSAPATSLMAAHMAQRGGRLQAISWRLTGAGQADETPRIEALAEQQSIPLQLFQGREHVPFSQMDEESVNPGWMEYNAFRPLHAKALQLAVLGDHQALANFTAGDFLYPTLEHLLPGLFRGGEWRAALTLLTSIMRHWSSGRRPWRNKALRGFVRACLPGSRPGRAFPYRLGFLTPEARQRLADLPQPFAESAAHPVAGYARFLQGTMAYHRKHESYFAERHGLHYLDPYQDEELAQFMLALPFSLSYRNGQSKWLMRQMAQGLIPESVRTGRRTGNLLGFLKFGYQQHQTQVAQLIGSQRTHWKRVLREERIDALLHKAQPSEADLVLICQLIGYSLWCRRWK